jgi:hypothetical protein
MQTSIARLQDAMEDASFMGYAWPGDDSFFSESHAPYMGDAITHDYLITFVREFATVYRSSCTFMTRKGQRSQPVSHYDELDTFTGRTHAQERVARVRKHERKRKREDAARRIKEKRDEQHRRLHELETQIRNAREEMATLL